MRDSRVIGARRFGVACVVALSTVALPQQALAAPLPTPVAGVVRPDPDERGPLTPDQVREQVAAAQRLEKELASSDKAVAAAQAKLARLAAESARLLNAVAAARVVQAAAAAEEAREMAALKALNAQVVAAHDDVNSMAYEAYVNGSGSLAQLQALAELAAAGDAGPAGAAIIDYLAEARAADGRKFDSLAQAQQAVVAKVIAARKRSEEAAKQATDAQAKAAANVAAQRKALDELQSVAAAKKAELESVRSSVDDAGVPSAVGLDPSALSALDSGALCSNDTGNYQNGRLPASALCPIRGKSGQYMRPAAARALNALAIAYQAEFGSELCITDTYRSYEQQVSVKRRKGRWAATPGTSQHGLGLATDLCGGIENFGTRQHRWMKTHAPIFGFFHPEWAGASGSLPEPWHWEYGT